MTTPQTTRSRLRGWRPTTLQVLAAAVVVLLGTRQSFAVYATKGMPPASVTMVAIGALGIYAALAGYRFKLGPPGISLTIVVYLLTIVVSFHVVTTRVMPANALITAGQGIVIIAFNAISTVAFAYVFAANPDRHVHVLETLLRALVIGATATAALALLQFVTGFDLAAILHIPGLMKFNDTGVIHGLAREGVVRAQGAAGHSLELSAVLTTVAPIGVALAYSTRASGRRYWPWVACTALILAGIVVTVSRSAFIGLGAAILVMSWFWPVRRLGALFAGALIVMALAILSGLGVVDAIVKTFLNSSKDTSLQSRARGIEYVSTHWTDHFWFGQGTSTYPLGPEQPVLDNEYLGRLMEGGVLGLLGLLLLLGVSIWYAARARSRCTDEATRELINGVLGALVALTIVSTILDVSGFQQISMIRWMLAVLAGACWWISETTVSASSPRVFEPVS